MSQPQLIDDEEHERVFEKVAAVDVAKASGMVCTRVPHRRGPASLTNLGRATYHVSSARKPGKSSSYLHQIHEEPSHPGDGRGA